MKFKVSKTMLQIYWLWLINYEIVQCIIHRESLKLCEIGVWEDWDKNVNKFTSCAILSGKIDWEKNKTGKEDSSVKGERWFVYFGLLGLLDLFVWGVLGKALLIHWHLNRRLRIWKSSHRELYRHFRVRVLASYVLEKSSVVLRIGTFSYLKRLLGVKGYFCSFHQGLDPPQTLCQ